MISVALPKGRLGESVYEMFERAGYGCPSIREKNRKLIFENAEAGVSYFWVKPSDVAIYVERGAADVGVAGAKGGCVIFSHGKILKTVKREDLEKEFFAEIDKCIL